MAADNAAVAARIGVKTSEVVSVEETDEGLVITTSNGDTSTAYIEVPDDRPDAEGKTGLMYLHRPHPGKTAVSFPVYASAEPEEIEGADADAEPPAPAKAPRSSKKTAPDA